MQWQVEMKQERQKAQLVDVGGKHMEFVLSSCNRHRSFQDLKIKCRCIHTELLPTQDPPRHVLSHLIDDLRAPEN